MNIKNNAIKMSLLIGVMLVCGCVSMPPADYTVQDVGILNNRVDAELVSLTVGYAPQAQQGKVETTHVVPPLWKEALTDALNRSLAFRDISDVRVNLSVRIVEFDLPSAGAAMKSKAGAIYEIVDRSNGDILFSQSITSEGIVPFDYALAGYVRATESMNRAVRNNISDFINSLEESDLSKPVFLGE